MEVVFDVRRRLGLFGGSLIRIELNRNSRADGGLLGCPISLIQTINGLVSDFFFINEMF